MTHWICRRSSTCGARPPGTRPPKRPVRQLVCRTRPPAATTGSELHSPGPSFADGRRHPRAIAQIERIIGLRSGRLDFRGFQCSLTCAACSDVSVFNSTAASAKCPAPLQGIPIRRAVSHPEPRLVSSRLETRALPPGSPAQIAHRRRQCHSLHRSLRMTRVCLRKMTHPQCPDRCCSMRPSTIRRWT